MKSNRLLPNNTYITGNYTARCRMFAARDNSLQCHGVLVLFFFVNLKSRICLTTKQHHIRLEKKEVHSKHRFQGRFVVGETTKSCIIKHEMTLGQYNFFAHIQLSTDVQ